MVFLSSLPLVFFVVSFFPFPFTHLLVSSLVLTRPRPPPRRPPLRPLCFLPSAGAVADPSASSDRPAIGLHSACACRCSCLRQPDLSVCSSLPYRFCSCPSDFLTSRPAPFLEPFRNRRADSFRIFQSASCICCESLHNCPSRANAWDPVSDLPPV